VKLNLVSLKQAVGSVLDFDFKQENVELDLNREDILFVGPLRTKGQIENLGDRIYQVTGQIEVEAKALCSRCLSATPISLNFVFSLKYSDIVSESGEEDIIPFFGDEIDLYPKILEEIVLNWPSQILCSSDCRGLCPNCGANMNTTDCKCKTDNIDPRFAVLKQLLKSD
jgi:uncharacterized protein